MLRTPGTRLLLVGLVVAILSLPLLAVYGLVRDREDQSQTAEASISAGWGGAQIMTGPVLVVPYVRNEVHVETIDGRQVSRSVPVRAELFLSPQRQLLTTRLDPHRRKRSIYASVIYIAAIEGTAQFALPADLAPFGVTRDELLPGEAQVRFGVSDPRGLQQAASVSVAGKPLPLQPGKGPAATGGAGFFGSLDWSNAQPIEIAWRYSLRGSHSLALVPRGGETAWQVSSRWPSPSFVGSFLPGESHVTEHGFSARYGVSNLALGEPLAANTDPGPPVIADATQSTPGVAADPTDRARVSSAAAIGLIDPVDLYSRVDRSVKYGFLFIGFTFLAFFMFDVVGGARVSTAEYLLTGAALVLFFVLLLAFAEVIGFAAAYVLASGATIGLLTAYSAAVLRSRKRAGAVGAMLTGLYAAIYVLLSLEDFSLLIGSVLLFVALAAVMYTTRNVEWSRVGLGENEATG